MAFIDNKKAQREGELFKFSKILTETDKALGFRIPPEDILWLPKSQIHVEIEGQEAWVYIPDWLEKKNELKLEKVERA